MKLKISGSKAAVKVLADDGQGGWVQIAEHPVGGSFELGVDQSDVDRAVGKAEPKKTTKTAPRSAEKGDG